MYSVCVAGCVCVIVRALGQGHFILQQRLLASSSSAQNFFFFCLYCGTSVAHSSSQRFFFYFAPLKGFFSAFFGFKLLLLFSSHLSYFTGVNTHMQHLEIHKIDVMGFFVSSSAHFDSNWTEK